VTWLTSIKSGSRRPVFRRELRLQQFRDMVCMGIESRTPIINGKTLNYDISNKGCVGGTSSLIYLGRDGLARNCFWYSLWCWRDSQHYYYRYYRKDG